MVMDERLFIVTTQEVRDVQWLMNVDLANIMKKYLFLKN